MSDYFPDEIILQILHKLPIKSLVSCTCVSKTWLSIIKNPSFISNHLKHSNKNNPLLLLRYHAQNNHNPSHATDQYSLYSDDNKQGFNHNLYMDFHVPFKTHRLNPFFRIVGTVNGLVCIVDDFYFDTQNIIIWNPFIKKSVTLPKPTTISNPASYEFNVYSQSNPVSYGFGFDSKSNDYKVLRLGKCENEEEPLVYSLNTNSWKRVCPPTYRITDIKEYPFIQVFVNGVIHVLAYKCHNFILGFDIGDEVFKEIKLPQSLADGGYPDFLQLLVYKESIAVIEKDWSRGIHVWVMEEYGVVDSWKKILSFDGEEGNWPDVFGYSFDEEDSNWPDVFGFRKYGELFLEFPNGEIVLYDCESTECTSLEVSGGSGGNTFVNYFVESIELLDNANAQSVPPDENDAIWDPPDDATD